jgi:hypothetical protein
VSAIQKWGKTIIDIDKFVRQLDDSIRGEAFRFLIMEDAKEGGADEPTKKVGSSAAHGGRDVAPQELIRQAKLTTVMDKAEILGFWLETHRGIESFTSADLKEAFKVAREPVPTNPSDVVAKLTGKGKLMEVDKRGGLQSYSLTGTAVGEVETWLSQQTKET